MILYRPIGTAELDLIAESNYNYAREIAEKWNTKTSDHKGYVTEFEVDDEYIKNFTIHTVYRKN